MQHSDNKLVQLTLEGDHHAFTTLVEKYQSQIHALIWRKIDDFHIAEDITQEVFLTAYQKLATLTHPDRFAKWLYIIANNLSVTWLRKQAVQPQLESLTSTNPEELEELCYAEYTAQQQEERGKESDLALIQKLLDKLREADRTVIHLYYLAEMTCEEISKFLGVSQNTIKSRLSRARKRLKKQAKAIEQTLCSFRLLSNFIETLLVNLGLPIFGMPLNPVRARSFYPSKYYR